MEAFSLDLRQRICRACDAGIESHREVAERFGVGRWFVQKLLRQRRLTGSVAPKPRGHGPPPAIGPADHARLRKLLKAKPDATLSELCRLLAGCGGPPAGVWTMCRALKRLRLVLKKRRSTRPSGTRPACGRCGGTSGGGSPPSTRRSWSSWTRAGSTRR